MYGLRAYPCGHPAWSLVMITINNLYCGYQALLRDYPLSCTNLRDRFRLPLAMITIDYKATMLDYFKSMLR